MITTAQLEQFEREKLVRWLRAQRPRLLPYTLPEPAWWTMHTRRRVTVRP